MQRVWVLTLVLQCQSFSDTLSSKSALQRMSLLPSGVIPLFMDSGNLGAVLPSLFFPFAFPRSASYLHSH